jgi:glycosyltransferase involved in cell wall biosynthesis
MPTVSVIIPCYNQGEYLPEAVDSVLAQTFSDVEVVIVNDGSTDPATVDLCNSYDDPRITVLNTANEGLAAARNNGIEAAGGRYILPLDADDKIASPYISEALSIIDSSPRTGIVYCRARLFGAVEGDWHLPDYSLDEMLRDNVIFCTALFRKEDWRRVGGYDTKMVYGWEDYDFWLSLIEAGFDVHRLEGRYFFYRVASDSMVRSTDKNQKIDMFKRIYTRHQQLFSDHIESWIEPLMEIREPYLTSRLYVDCGEGLSNESSLARKIEQGRRVLRYPLTSFNQIKALRFDPAEKPICLDLRALELVFGSGTDVVDLSQIQSNATVRDGNRFMFSTDDPQIVPLVDNRLLASAIEMVVTIDVIASGAEALQHIIDFQRARIETSGPLSSLMKWFRPFR